MTAPSEAVSADRAAFERDGYLVFDPQIPEKTIDGAVTDAEHHFRRSIFKPRPVQDRYTDEWSKSKNVRKIALAPVPLALLRDIYGREPRPFQTLNFRVGTQQSAHSDAVHFNTEPPGFMCAVWVALEDIDMDNGPLIYYPGSHKLPELRPSDVGIKIEAGQQEVSGEDYHDAYEPFVQKQIEREGMQPEYGTLRKGQALLWATNLLHGGTAVRDPSRTRHSQVTHYFFEGARLWTPLLTGEGQVSYREAPAIR